MLSSATCASLSSPTRFTVTCSSQPDGGGRRRSPAARLQRATMNLSRNSTALTPRGVAPGSGRRFHPAGCGLWLLLRGGGWQPWVCLPSRSLCYKDGATIRNAGGRQLLLRTKHTPWAWPAVICHALVARDKNAILRAVAKALTPEHKTKSGTSCGWCARNSNEVMQVGYGGTFRDINVLRSSRYPLQEHSHGLPGLLQAVGRGGGRQGPCSWLRG